MRIGGRCRKGWWRLAWRVMMMMMMDRRGSSKWSRVSRHLLCWRKRHRLRGEVCRAVGRGCEVCMLVVF